MASPLGGIGALAKLTPQGQIGDIAAQALGGSSASGIKGPTSAGGGFSIGGLNFNAGGAGSNVPLYVVGGIAVLALILLLRK